jgi:hypothetical protein
MNGWTGASVVSIGLALATVAYADTDPPPKSVEVSAMASGGFGTPPQGFLPLTEVLTVRKESIITIKYEKGTWCFGIGLCTGPNGATFDNSGFATPLQESIGVLGGTVTNIGALIGAFVPEALVKTPGFQALDGTLLTSGVGIMPNCFSSSGPIMLFRLAAPGRSTSVTTMATSATIVGQ